MKSTSSASTRKARRSTSSKPGRGRHGRSPAKTPSPERILHFAWSYAPTLILESALNFRLFDRLEKSPKIASALAKETGTSVRGLTAILNALVSLNFLKKRPGGKYALTPESDMFLVSNKPSYHGAFLHHMVRQVMPTWMELNESVRTGQPAGGLNDEEDGASFFAEFVESLFPVSFRAAQILGQDLRIAQLDRPVTVLDIGAGSGVWGIALALQSPHVNILAVDWPKVLPVTRRIAERHGLRDRLKTSPGDLLEADFGQRHHVATLGHILHSEGRDRSRRLLKRVYDALAPGGTVAISEFMPNNERTGPPNTLIFAINMLVHTNEGDTFTFREMSEWLLEAGFIKPRLLEAPAPSPLLLATKK